MRLILKLLFVSFCQFFACVTLLSWAVQPAAAGFQATNTGKLIMLPFPPILAGSNPPTLNFGAVKNAEGNTASTTPYQTVIVQNPGSESLPWRVTANDDWLICSPTSGVDSGTVNVFVAPCSLMPGNYKGSFTIADPMNPQTYSQTVNVNLHVYSPSQDMPPFGAFNAPTDNATVSSSIPVTGWALDDVGVESVKIYGGTKPDQLTHIGDAALVEGARPDVTAAYPDVAANDKAGWGYMMLTNFLPNGGNGTYYIRAVATDTQGNQTILGAKTIYCDNQHAGKPFGAIETPAQGEIASGNDYANWGWALTPPPARIPTDGSTINVWVDGVNLGHPNYNVYRKDIASFFPGYENSDGAAGFFNLDTTAYASGVHTIQWTARDNAGNSDGIGSRFFTIQNPDRDHSLSTVTRHNTNMSAISTPMRDSDAPMQYRTGHDVDAPLVTATPDGNDKIRIYVQPSSRLELRLGQTGFSGYSFSNNDIRTLPIGSALDSAGAIFNWGPGPGVVGDFDLVFIRDTGDDWIKKEVTVTIADVQPIVTANGQAASLTVTSGESVDIAVRLLVDDLAGLEVDYWLLAYSSSGWKSFGLDGWQDGVSPLLRYELFSIPTGVQLAKLTAPLTNTTVYFAVSTPDMAELWYSAVQIEVK